MALAKKSKEIPGAFSLWSSEEKTNNDVCGEEPIIGFNALESSWEKKGDWRFDNYCLICGTDRQKELIWIGTIDLKIISEKSSSIPMLFLENGVMRNDYALASFENGAPRLRPSVYEYKFNINLIRDVLLKAKKDEYAYFHVLLKETVDGVGRHFVSLLRNENILAEHYCGIPSNVKCAESDYYVLRKYDHLDLQDYEERVMLFNDEYKIIK